MFLKLANTNLFLSFFFLFSDWLVGLGPWNGLCKSMHITEDVKNVMLSLESIPFTERAHYFKQVFLILNIYLSYFKYHILNIR